MQMQHPQLNQHQLTIHPVPFQISNNNLIIESVACKGTLFNKEVQ